MSAAPLTDGGAEVRGIGQRYNLPLDNCRRGSDEIIALHQAYAG